MFGLMKLPSLVNDLRSRGYRIEIVVDKKYFLKIYEPATGDQDRVLLVQTSADSLDDLMNKIPMNEF